MEKSDIKPVSRPGSGRCAVIRLLVAVICLAVALASCGGSVGKEDPNRVALVTYGGGVDDLGRNQQVWEELESFGQENSVRVSSYVPAKATSEAVAEQVRLAVEAGNNILILPGTEHAATLLDCASKYPTVKFIALDVREEDIVSLAVEREGGTFSGMMADYELSDYIDMSNVFCAGFREEIGGYMAGYAAVRLGFNDLGFLGSTGSDRVKRWGYGFCQGADAAAKAMEEDVNIEYIYAGQEEGDADIRAVMDAWYSNGTEIVLTCGGTMYESVLASAKNIPGAKIIGSGTDMAALIARLAAGVKPNAQLTAAEKPIVDGFAPLTVMSAVEFMGRAARDVLTDIIVNDAWSDYAGQFIDLGLVSNESPDLNYIGLASIQYESNYFVELDYRVLVRTMFDGTLTVYPDISAPTPDGLGCLYADIDYLGYIKTPPAPPVEEDDEGQDDEDTQDAGDIDNQE